MRDIGFVGPLPSPTGPFAVNNRGHAAGVKSQNAAAGTRGFLWTPEDGIIEIHPPGALRSFVNGMNDHDQLTGSYVTSLTPLMSRASPIHITTTSACLATSIAAVNPARELSLMPHPSA